MSVEELEKLCWIFDIIKGAKKNHLKKQYAAVLTRLDLSIKMFTEVLEKVKEQPAKTGEAKK